jgi:hypothetical protein
MHFNAKRAKIIAELELLAAFSKEAQHLLFSEQTPSDQVRLDVLLRAVRLISDGYKAAARDCAPDQDVESIEFIHYAALSAAHRSWLETEGLLQVGAGYYYALEEIYDSAMRGLNELGVRKYRPAATQTVQ